MSKALTVLLTCALIAGIAACSDYATEAPPENLLKEDTYINLLIELQLLKSYQESIPPDSTDIDSLKNEIFDRYGATEQQFRISHDYYQIQVEEQRQRVIRAIDSLRMEVGGSESAGIDTLEGRRSQ